MTKEERDETYQNLAPVQEQVKETIRYMRRQRKRGQPVDMNLCRGLEHLATQNELNAKLRLQGNIIRAILDAQHVDNAEHVANISSFLTASDRQLALLYAEKDALDASISYAQHF